MRVDFDGRTGFWAIFQGKVAVITFANKERALSFFREFVRNQE